MIGRLNMTRTATCCCGKASLDVQGSPELHGICHCSDCKKRTGSAFGISAYFKSDNVLNIRGEFSCYSLQGSQTNALQQRYFCKACGTTLYWKISTSPDLIGVAGGCFSQSPLGEPTYSSSTKGKLTWVKLPWRCKKYP